MLTVSGIFADAEVADIAQTAAKVFLVRGNYASAAAFGATATATDSDASGSFPPAGAIDGDRTELNVGAASAADNGVGLASWKSASTPSGASPVTYTVTFNAVRTFNWVKLYNLAADPLTSYILQYNDGTGWITIGGTVDQGYGTGVTGGLDQFDSSGSGTNYSGTAVRVVIYGTKNADAAQIVELEVWYKHDITARTTGLRVSRQRDWKQVQPMAATLELSVDNSDRFFSVSHVPTAAELSGFGNAPLGFGLDPFGDPSSLLDAGFFNQELRTGMPVIVQLGFYFPGVPYSNTGFGSAPVGFGQDPFGDPLSSPANPELVSSFVGTLDSIPLQSRPGTCTMTARDGMKALFNLTTSSRLKQNLDTSACIQYCLNLCNVSNYEMSLSTTNLIQPYFFFYDSNVFTMVQQLVQASGNAAFWYDESGTATFVDYLTSSGNSHTDFVFTLVDLSQYTVVNAAQGSVDYGAVNSNELRVINSSGAGDIDVVYPSTGMTGWQWTMGATGTGAGNPEGGFAFAVKAYAVSGAFVHLTGYGLHVFGGTVQLVRYDNQASLAAGGGGGGAPTSLGSAAYDYSSSVFTVICSKTGGTQKFYVYKNAVLIITATDSTYTTSNYAVFTADASGWTTTLSASRFSVLNPTYAVTVSGTNLTFTSAPVKQTNISAEGNLQVGFAPSNAPVTFQTRTSPDGLGSWSAWTSVTLDSTQQGAIPSAANSYIEYQFFFDTSGNVLWPVYYAIVNWTLSAVAGTIRSLAYNSNLCEVEQVVSDSLAGDSSVVNAITVVANPLILTGLDTDTQWQGTFGFPAANISATNPLLVAVGTVTIQAVIEGGMDVAKMSGASPAALVITYGTAVGTATISYVHPTTPIITLTITGAGTITALKLQGKAFSSATTPISVTAQDSKSQALNGKRTGPQISNNWITIPAIAQLIANKQLALYKSPPQVLQGVEILFAPSVQLSDAAQATDYNLDLSTAQTWNLSGIEHEYRAGPAAGSASVKTKLAAVLAV